MTLTSTPTVDYPVLFAFETGEWWDYVMLIVVTAALAITAWLAQRNKWVVLAVFVIAPVLLTIFWWPYSTQGTGSAGWFPIVKQYSALAGSLCLVALQYSQKLRRNQWYLLIPQLFWQSIFWKQSSVISSAHQSTTCTQKQA